MLVKELIRQLKFMDENAEVHFAYSYGDYWHTEVAPKINTVAEGIVEFSDYHRMDKVVEEDEDIYDQETGAYKTNIRRVVIID